MSDCFTASNPVFKPEDEVRHHFRNQQPDFDQKLSFSFTAFLMFSFDHTFTYGPG